MTGDSVVIAPMEAFVTVIDETDIVQIVEEIPFIEVMAVGPQGPPGPKGDTGAPSFTYEHEQVVPQSVWSVGHGLGGFPNVTVVDSTGRVVIGDVEYIDDNSLQLIFSAAFSGKAYVS